jgi:hypothetical protein
MKTKTSGLDERFLLAPSRLVTAYLLRSGYDIGIAVTAASLDFEFPDFALGDDQLGALDRAVTAVEQGHDAFYWRPALTEDEVMALEIGEIPLKTARERLREKQERLKKIQQAVAEADIWLPALIRHGLVLMVTTRRKEFAPVPASMAPKHPFAAVVGVQITE